MKLINGDSLIELGKMEENSIDSIVCDPPYEIGFMNKGWDSSGIATTPEIWEKCLRVLKPGGYLLSFAGTRTQHRITSAIEDAGFQIRDVMMYMFGSGFPKSHNVSLGLDKLEGAGNRGHAISAGSKKHPTTGKDRPNGEKLDRYEPKSELGKKYDGWGTGLLKPAYEPIIVARKPLSEPTIAKNIKRWGTGGHNVDACRIGYTNEADKKSAKPGSFNYKEDTYKDTMRSQTTMDKLKDNWVQPTGRFPANVILECTCDEIIPGTQGEAKITNRERNKGFEVRGKDTTKGIDNYNDTGAIHTNPDCPCYILDQQGPIGKPAKTRSALTHIGKFFGEGCDANEGKVGFWPGDNGGGVSRYFYTSKPSKKEKNAGLDGLPLGEPPASARSKPAIGRTSPLGKPRANTHPTVKPIDLMEYLIKLVTPPDGVCLDCFMGSGTTAIAAQNLGIDFIGIEMEEEYFIIAKKRIKYWKEKLNDRTVDLFE